MTEISDPLYTLLRRALDDDGPEGTVAWEMFKRRAKATPGKLFFLTDDNVDPLMYVVRDYQAQVLELEVEVSRLKAFVARTLRTCEKIIYPNSKPRH